MSEFSFSRQGWAFLCTAGGAGDGDEFAGAGQGHPATLTSMANLTSTNRNQGCWKEVEELGSQFGYLSFVPRIGIFNHHSLTGKESSSGNRSKISEWNLTFLRPKGLQGSMTGL